ncbi:MAG: ParB/Srx family N-terminal domain-containing protein [Anaerorhabdus sp.]
MINYNQVQVNQDLIMSIAQRGIIIPIKVMINDEGIYCVDGHKRCSACQILEETENREIEVNCMITNDFSKSGSTYWGAHNHH